MTSAICRMTRSLSRMALAEKSNDSAQSPAWRSTARPSATAASDCDSARASPAKTSGGKRRSRSSARFERVGVGPLRLLRSGPGPPRTGGPRPLGIGEIEVEVVQAALRGGYR